MPAKSFFGGLKAMDAFGKVRHARHSKPTNPAVADAHDLCRPWKTSRSERALGRSVRTFPSAVMLQLTR
jgi:hypothetical protein